MSSDTSFSLLILFSLLLLLILDPADLTVARSCIRKCGGLEIPFPFGVGEGCYLEKWYEIKCVNTSLSGKLVPFLSVIGKEVVNISLPSQDTYYSVPFGSVRIRNEITSKGCSSDGEELGSHLNLTDTPFFVTPQNRLIAVGCNNTASLTNIEPYMVGCKSSCGTKDHTPTKDSLALLTCEVNSREPYAKSCDARSLTRDTSCNESLGCISYENFNYNLPDEERYKHNCVCNYHSALNYTTCTCSSGYKGNPYIPGDCKDINECVEKSDGYPMYQCDLGKTCLNTQGHYKCVYTYNRLLAIGMGSSFGSLIFIGGIYLLYKFIKKKRKLNQKKKFFKRNGGLLLQQQLTSTEGNVENTKVFTSRELEKATENFSLNRILGQGGQGTVYKGMLVDGRIVAVKKSKVVDEDKLEEFINEVVILSQINHRNIVQLLGCCLETNVPVLVYEFIPNGNLFEHLHDDCDDNTMFTWEVRLRIAVDIAGALSYLHSSASSPIYHRDVKSTNIMLDEKYRAKVSDFGTSRSVTVDHTHLTTVVSGTVGYMDPEYFQSSQFTAKSDVYSFGVVLAELITGEKSISFLRSIENRTLATYFISAVKEKRLFDIIDGRIRDGCKLYQVSAAAKVARKCLHLKGRKRPSMREVSMELEKIRASSVDMLRDEYASENEDEEEDTRVVETNIAAESWNNASVTAPASQYNAATSSLSSSDIEPLFPLQTR